MISIDFGNDLEWWTQNIRYEQIVESIPVATDRDEAVKLRLRQAFGAGGLEMTDVAEDMRTDLIGALLCGAERVIEATEPQAGTEEGDRNLEHLRKLRDTARAALAALG